MTHEYQVSGITCEGCVAKVKSLLEKTAGVSTASVGRDGLVQITMSHHVETVDLQAALRDFPKYQLKEKAVVMPKPVASADKEIEKTWLETYKPILLIFAYITGVTLLASGGNFMDWMRYFMAGFFLVFSFFKMLNLSGFADSYAMYDIVAKRFRAWGFIYPFVELVLGLAFLMNFQPVFTNWATLIIMSVSAVGVIQSVTNKRKIQCACLGAVFNLPMSTVTIIEDLLMVAMAVIGLFML
ncbi:MAG: cation transporter [Saprospiraceae bacterium]|nr:cation transporter [Saprospiraceae bacterium]